jgi:hypothetical protein
MHFQPHEIPMTTPESPVAGMRSIKAGDTNIEIGYSWCNQASDNKWMYKGLPNDSCPCDHYGYVKSGSFRILYDDGTEEAVEENAVYFIPGGHIWVYDEPCELIEFNPHDQFQVMIEHFNKVNTEARAKNTGEKEA